MRKIHFTDKYLLSPYHPVTVLVAGAAIIIICIIRAIDQLAT